MKTKKRLVAIVMAAVLMFGVAPGFTAYGEAFSLPVEEIQTTSPTALHLIQPLSGDVLDFVANPSPRNDTGWNWSGNTLTLTGANLERVLLPTGSTMIVNGPNTISGSLLSAIVFEGNLIIEGSGTLDIDAEHNGIFTNYTGDRSIVVQGGVTINMDCGESGIHFAATPPNATSHLTVNDAILNIRSDAAGIGLFPAGTITMNHPDSVINITAGTGSPPSGANGIMGTNSMFSMSNGSLTVIANPLAGVWTNIPAANRNITGGIIIHNGNVVGGSISGASVTAPAQTFTNTLHTPTPNVTLGGTTLTLGTDFTVTSHANNTNAGTATVTITGAGQFAGTATGSFTINPASIPTVAITLTAPATGNPPSNTAHHDSTAPFTTGAVTWTPNNNPFSPDTQYTAQVTLTADANHTFTGLTTATINGQTANITNNTGAAVTLSYQFPATDLVLSSDNNITTFTIPGQVGTTTINTTSPTTGTIAITMPYSTNVTALVPTIAHSGASISPASGTSQNFTNPVSYTVTAANGDEKMYTVTVTIAPPSYVQPAITGQASMTLTAGYTATYTRAFTISGSPAPTITTDTTHGGYITWNNAESRLDIAPGLPAGTYPVVLTAANIGGSDTHTFTLTVNAQQPITHTVTVNGGTGATGGGDFAQDATVNITAGQAPAGQRFSHWTATPAVTFANANSASTSFTMPNDAVTVTAHWTAIQQDTGGGNVEIVFNNESESDNRTHAQSPSISRHPLSTTVYVDEETTLSITVGITDSGTLTFQWYRAEGERGGRFTAIPDATEPTLTPSTTTAGTNRYRVAITNTNNARAIDGNRTARTTSRIATVTVNERAITPAPQLPPLENDPPPAPAPEPLSSPSPLPLLRFTVGSHTYTHNGATLQSDAEPFIDPEYNRLMIPLRLIAEAMGAYVEWEHETQTVNIITATALATLTIGDPLPDGMGVPVIVNDRTFVPLRYVTEVLGAEVEWDETNRAVYVFNLAIQP